MENEKAERRKAMQRIYQARYKSKHPERVKEIELRWKEKHPVVKRLKSRISSRKERQSVNGKRIRVEQVKRYYSQTAFAENHNRRWSDDEIKAIFDNSKTDMQISEAIGRSMMAILAARRRYLDRKPVGWVSKSTQKHGDILFTKNEDQED